MGDYGKEVTDHNLKIIVCIIKFNIQNEDLLLVTRQRMRKRREMRNKQKVQNIMKNNVVQRWTKSTYSMYMYVCV